MKRTFSLILSTLVSAVLLSFPLPPSWGQTPPDESQALEEQIDRAVELTGQGEHQQAIETLQQALESAQNLQERKQEATTLNNLGAVYRNIGQPQKALEYYNRALPIHREIENRSGEATTLHNLGTVYDDTGQPQKALEYFNQALPIDREIGNRFGEAATLNNLGEVHRDIGQPQKALEYYDRALPIFREVGERFGEAVTLNNLGLVYDGIGQPHKALEYYNRALPIHREVGNRFGEAATLNNLGQVSYKTGQLQTALEYFNQALPIFREIGNRSGEASTLHNLGGVYDGIGQLHKALEYYKQALPLRRKVGDRPGEASTLNSLGTVYRSLGKLQKALEYYNRALPIHREVGNRSGEAATLNNLGEVYDGIGESQKALEYYNRALPILKEVGNRGIEAITLNNLGVVYRDIGQPQKALEYYKQALPIRREVGDRSGEADTLNNLGWVYRDLNQPQKAIENLEQSLSITLELRRDLKRENRQSFVQTQPGTEIALVDLLIDQNQPRRAYEWANRSATADLADYARLLDAKVQDPEAQKAIDEWNQNNQQLEFIRQQLQGNFSEERAQEMRELEAEVHREAEEIRNRFPEVAELFETTPTDIAQLQQNLPVGTVLIQPITLSDAIAVFILTRDELNVTKTDIDSDEFDQLLNEYLAQLQDPKNTNYLTTSQQLYNLLIRPVAAEIDSLNPQSLAIIATGELRDLPFETLHDGQQYLIQKYPIHYLTRLSSRPQTQNGWQNQLETLVNQGSIQTGAILLVLGGVGFWGIRKANRVPLRLAMGVGVVAVGSILVATSSQPTTVLGLGNPVPEPPFALKEAEAEVTEIANALPGSQTYLGHAATLENFKTQSPRFPILHLATHGCFQPQGCCLRDEGCTEKLDMVANTLLFANREQYNIADAALLGLNDTELIALSACQTARNTNSDGQNLPGLAYIFERAGAKAVMASLWNVEDKATKEIMVEFYGNLKRGTTKAEAMRQAKLSQINRHPFFWSPFVLIGDGR